MTKIVQILFRENTIDVVISYHICLTFDLDTTIGSQPS